MHADEQTDAAVGGGAREDRQNREQQQGSEAVTLALAAARIGDRFQGGEQAGERHHGGLRCEGLALNRPGGWLVPQPQTPPSQTASVQNRTALSPIKGRSCSRAGRSASPAPVPPTGRASSRSSRNCRWSPTSAWPTISASPPRHAASA